jgi:hypothetical protein
MYYNQFEYPLFTVMDEPEFYKGAKKAGIYFVETTKALQKAILQTVGYQKNLLIETVSKVQGLTPSIPRRGKFSFRIYK